MLIRTLKTSEAFGRAGQRPSAQGLKDPTAMRLVARPVEPASEKAAAMEGNVGERDELNQIGRVWHRLGERVSSVLCVKSVIRTQGKQSFTGQAAPAVPR